MKYEVVVGGRTFQVSVQGDVVQVGGRAREAGLLAMPGSPLKRISVDGVSRTYAMSRTAEGWTVQRWGRALVVEVTDERAQSLRQMVGARKSRSEGGIVRAPMPGLVVRVEVEPGQKVQPGSGLLVLEAMKMENEIRSSVGGVVKRIGVAAGQKVEKGADLLEIVAEQG